MGFVFSIRARNVNDAFAQSMSVLSGPMALREETRNGPVRSLNVPVITITDEPRHRVLFSPLRDANPFFHFFESLWMLNGQNDLSVLTQFNKGFGAYSDDGGATQPAAYGYRWRKYFGYDQLEAVIEELLKRPNSRRAVLAMWDGGGDLQRALGGSADIPCNTQCYFRVTSDGKLDMAVTCRSNDAVWGAHGANAVHFSVLQEYLAARLARPVGVLYQFSWNYHLYEKIVANPAAMAVDAVNHDYYTTKKLRPYPMFADLDSFHDELPYFMKFISTNKDIPSAPFMKMINPLLLEVALPMWDAWRAHKAKDYAAADLAVSRIRAEDWRAACAAWIERRALKHRENTDVA